MSLDQSKIIKCHPLHFSIYPFLSGGTVTSGDKEGILIYSMQTLKLSLTRLSALFSSVPCSLSDVISMHGFSYQKYYKVQVNRKVMQLLHFIAALLLLYPANIPQRCSCLLCYFLRRMLRENSLSNLA